MTWLELTNEVLKRLREATVSTVSANPYSALIGSFVNEAKREVEDSWDWNVLRSTISVNTVASTGTYILTGAAKRSRLIDAWNGGTEMQEVGSQVMNRFYYSGTQSGSPYFFNYNGESGGDPKVDLWPIADAVYPLKFTLCIPQPDLAADGTELVVPDWPVVLGAWAKSINERGEDGGQTTQGAYDVYRFALGDAISHDTARARDELVWSQ